MHDRRPRLARRPHIVANALAAAALARAHGVSQAAVRDGLRAFRPDGHRIAVVGERDGVTWVDDSKATNPHAAQSSLQAYDPVVWVAGGLAKGARFDELVLAVRDRLRGVVLLGRDRDVIAGALSRHAPDVPVIVVGDDETGRTKVDMPWSASWAPQPSWLDPATRSCWLPDAPPWTCSPTTPSAETRSPTPYDAGCDDRHQEEERDDHRGPPRRSPGRRRSAVHGWFAAVRHALDRPLTAYYLLLGASALLLTIGLIMVLSASSVYSYAAERRRLLRRRQAPADVGADRRPVRLGRLPAAALGACAGSPGSG